MTRDEPAGSEHGLSREEVASALATLDELCRAEYQDTSLEDVLLDPNEERSALRLQRLTGIALKRPFAKSHERTELSRTGAARAWIWVQDDPEGADIVAPAELALIRQLRTPGEWNDRNPPSGNDELMPWWNFTGEVEHERGLFKLLALYIGDKLRGRGVRALREYTEAEESKRLEAGLDMAAMVFDAKVTAPLVGLIGIPSVVVGAVLIASRFGYRMFTDPDSDGGDSTG